MIFNFNPQILEQEYNLHGTHAILLDRLGGRGYHAGTFTGGPEDHHDKHVSGEEMIRRIAWARRRIQSLEEASRNMTKMLNGETIE